MLISPVQALAAFQWFSVVGCWESHFSWWERNLVIYVGALAMFLLSKRLKKRHNLKDDVRESLYDDCNMWTKALQKWVSQITNYSMLISNYYLLNTNNQLLFAN